jgi:SAM-dependent methyltransferase
MNKKLNLGCGTDIKEGWVNLDIADIPGVDVVHNVEDLPLPFADNTFEVILCQDILEHVNLVPVLRDLHRILVPGGELRLRVPHFTSRNNYADPTHIRAFSVDTWSFFVRGKDGLKSRDYYFNFGFSGMKDRSITFEQYSRKFFYNRFVKGFVNKNAKRQTYYEQTGLSRLFPAENILVTLIK